MEPFGRQGEMQMATGGRVACLSVALLAGAAIPVLAQSIETVNVTAEHRLEDLQTVPMAISAFQAGEIAGRRIEGVRDIQFATPNVNFTKNNFTSSNFSIRGVGTQVISGDSEYGVAFNVDEVYYATPPIDAPTRCTGVSTRSSARRSASRSRASTVAL